MRKRMLSGTAFLLFFFFSCSSEPGLDSRQEAEPAVSVETLADGVLIGSSKEIPISLSYSDEFAKKGSSSPLSLDAVLNNPEGVNLATLHYDGVVEGKLPSVILPALESGYYVLHFTLRDGTAIVAEKSLTFFHDLGEFKITKISAFPVSILPGSACFLKLSAVYPEYRDPYVRWTIDGKTVQEELISLGGDGYVWTAPQKVGVYSVKAELFPFPPRETDQFSFASGIILTSQVFVSSTRRLLETDFTPDSQYYSLFHFLGSLTDDGIRTNKKLIGSGNIGRIGNPLPGFRKDVYGFALDGSTGFSVDQSLLPTENGLLLPFTLRMRLLPSAESVSKNWFEWKDRSGFFVFSVGTDGTGVPQLTLLAGDRALTFPSGAPAVSEKPLLVEAAVAADESGVSVTWTVDGIMTGTRREAFTLPVLSQEGTTRIGGVNGFIGIIDELGVRLDGAVPNAPAVSSLGAVSKTGSRPPLRTSGNVALQGGKYILKPGASVAIDSFEITEGLTRIVITSDFLEGSKSSQIELARSEKDAPEYPPFFILKRSGPLLKILLDGKSLSLDLTPEGSVSINVFRAKKRIEVSCLGQTEVLDIESEGSSFLSITISNPEDAISLFRLSDVLIRTGADDPLNRLLDVINTEKKP